MILICKSLLDKWLLSINIKLYSMAIVFQEILTVSSIIFYLTYFDLI